MRELARLFLGVMYKRALLLYRYKINTVASIATIYILFLVTLFGGRAIGGGAFNDSLASIVVGFFLVTTSISAYNELANTFTREASWGTLEQLFMCRVGFGKLTLFTAAGNVLVSMLIGATVLVAMLLTTDVQVGVDLVSVVPVFVLAIASIAGVGFLFGGAAVVYKRIGNVFSVIQFGFVGLVAAPVEQYPALKLLPLTQGSYLLQRVMTEDVRIWEIAPTELAILVATGVGYAAVGYLLMLQFVRVARRRGVMGHY